MIVESPEQFVEVQRECIKKIHDWIDLANMTFNLKLAYPQVLFALNGMTGGTANYGTNVIKVNPTLLRENVTHYLQQTTGHEVAHLVARTMDPCCEPHGELWKSVMQAFGLPPSRCHQYDVSNVPSQFGNRRRESKYKQPDNIKDVGCGTMIEF